MIPSYHGDTTTSSIEGKACKMLLLKVSHISAEKTCESHWRLMAIGEGEVSYYQHHLTIFFIDLLPNC